MTKAQRLVLVVSILASFVANLDASVVNVALPAITRNLGGGLTAQQWIVDAYLLTLGSLILIAGSLSDLFGRKKVLALGLGGFLVTSLLCAIAPNDTFLIVSRAFQGLAGALLVPSSLALIISAFSGPAQGKAIGAWTGWISISYIIGPLLGGFLVDTASWRWVFAINVVPIAITLILLKGIHQKESLPKNVRVDFGGALLCVIGLGGAVSGLIEQPRYGWHSVLVLSTLIGGALALVLFVLYERRIKQPMLTLELFKVRNFSVGNVATVSIYAGLSIATFTLLLFLQQAVHFSALKAGMSILPVTLIMFFLSSRFGALAGRFGPRFFMGVGPIVAGLGFLAFLRVNTHVSYMQQLLPGIIIFGLGLCMTVAPLTAAVLGNIAPEHAGVGSAVNNAVARVAGLIAIGFIGLVIGAEAFSTGSIAHSVGAFHRAAIAMAVLLIAGGIISAIGIQNAKLQPKVAVPAVT